MIEETARMDATAQAELVRRREVKPIELVDAAIERIERLNPRLNAVVTPMYDEARRLAQAGLQDAPFAGVPFLLKDLVASYAGVRCTSGSAFLCDYEPACDSELVTRFKRSGLIVLGKTNVPEFGILPTTESRFLGPCRNPWNTELSPGGSSGGSAAAVAAGLVPMAHGNDGGGSIRIPSSCCGLFGLKPTRARNPLGPDLGDMVSGLVVEHALTRSVRDSAALLDATSGPGVGDPYYATPPARPFLDEVTASPGRLLIGFTCTAVTGVPVHPDCAAAVNDAASLCSQLGHDVQEATFSLDGELITRAFIASWAAMVAWDIARMERITGKTPTQEDFEPLTWALYESGCQQSSGDYLLAVTDLQQVSRQIAGTCLNYDVMLMPTIAEPPPPLGTFDSPPDNPWQGLFQAASFLPFTPLCNITGQPGMSMPLFWNSQGLPIGTQFAAHYGDEAILFRLAAQLEAARPWAGRRPPVSA
ncbi:MAG: amidase family protein [Chloroflexota bacterium]|nr:amidase family protein [Chloroflexota bacterium]